MQKSLSSLSSLLTKGGRTAAVSRRILLVRKLGGHSHAPPPPTFARLPEAKSRLHEESELVWHDGVAPELAIDFDAPELSRR